MMQPSSVRWGTISRMLVFGIWGCQLPRRHSPLQGRARHVGGGGPRQRTIIGRGSMSRLSSIFGELCRAELAGPPPSRLHLAIRRKGRGGTGGNPDFDAAETNHQRPGSGSLSRHVVLRQGFPRQNGESAEARGFARTARSVRANEISNVGSAQGVLEAMAKRMKHAAWVVDTEVTLVAT